MLKQTAPQITGRNISGISGLSQISGQAPSLFKQFNSAAIKRDGIEEQASKNLP
jgi:hypothetical protein